MLYSLGSKDSTASMMAHAGSIRLSRELEICSSYGCSNQHAVCDLYLVFFNVFISA
jgi:hypothetical protein